MPKKIIDIVPPTSKATQNKGAPDLTKKQVKEPTRLKSTAGRKPRGEPKISKMKEVSRTELGKLSLQDQFLASLAKAKIPQPKSDEEKPKTLPAIPKSGSKMRLFIFVSILVLGVIAGLYGLGFAISRAEIELKTVKNFQPFELQIQLRQNPSWQEQNLGIIPLKKITKDTQLSKEYQATGEGQVLSYAHGKILVYNEYNTQPQVLIEKTRFMSPDGKIFRIPKRIVVPGGKLVGGKLEPGFTETEVVADQPGPEYNIGPTRFTIPGFEGSPRFEKFYGVSKEKFAGGAKGFGKIVLEEDIRKAQEDISRIAFEDLKTKIAQELPSNTKFLQEASQIKVIKLESSAKPQDGQDTFLVNIEAQITSLVFDEITVKDLIAKRFSESSRNEFMKPIYEVNYSVKNADYNTGTLTLSVNGKRNMEQSIDSLALKRAILGQNAEGVRKQILGLEGIEEAKISFWPFWVKRIPWKIERVTIKVI
ncbi:MAG: hypothetical protein ACK4NX_00785 [Candidatus Paceibacteria bacterium]